jgi:hypothetical protein
MRRLNQRLLSWELTVQKLDLAGFEVRHADDFFVCSMVLRSGQGQLVVSLHRP